MEWFQTQLPQYTLEAYEKNNERYVDVGAFMSDFWGSYVYYTGGIIHALTFDSDRSIVTALNVMQAHHFNGQLAGRLCHPVVCRVSSFTAKKYYPDLSSGFLTSFSYFIPFFVCCLCSYMIYRLEWEG